MGAERGPEVLMGRVVNIHSTDGGPPSRLTAMLSPQE